MNWNELSQSPIEGVLAWAAPQPWAGAMADCAQDAQWHAEGDVWTHTRLVCAELPKLPEWPALTAHERTVLTFAAMFHDAGKATTTQVEPGTGRLKSPKHAVAGEHLARAVLREAGCDLATREEIARLVRFHSRPGFLLEKNNPAHEVVALSWWACNMLLYLLALADTRGRAASDSARPEENIHLWKMVAEENGCFDGPYPFANPKARFLFYHREEMDLHYVPHEQYRAAVTVVSGLPGSGKDTWLAKHRPDRPVVSLDELRDELGLDATDDQGEVIQLGRQRCRELLRAGKPFAFSATNLLRQTRQRWIDLFADYDARIEIVYIEPPLPTIFAQNRRRERNVPEQIIRDLAAKLEPPTWAETHDLVLHQP